MPQVADTDNHAIKYINLTTAEVTLFAGSPVATVGSSMWDYVGTNALFHNPTGICLGNNDNLAFVTSDDQVGKIWQIEMATRTVSWITGSSGAGAAPDGIGNIIHCLNRTPQAWYSC